MQELQEQQVSCTVSSTLHKMLSGMSLHCHQAAVMQGVDLLPPARGSQSGLLTGLLTAATASLKPCYDTLALLACRHGALRAFEPQYAWQPSAVSAGGDCNFLLPSGLDLSSLASRSRCQAAASDCVESRP